jgi:hypothetical protein
MRKILALVILALAWIFSMYQLYTKEAASGKRVNFMYKKFLPPDLVLRDEWFGIYFNNNKIGYANFTFGLDEVDARQGYKMEGEAFLIFPVLGTTQRVWLKMRSKIGPDYKLKNFYLSFFTGMQRTEISGLKIGENKFELTVKESGNERKSIISIPEGAVLGGFFGPPKELHNPHPGMEMKFFTFNPLTLQPEEVKLVVLSPERIDIWGQKYKAYPVITEFSGLESRAWIDEQGRLLKEETPLGITLLREPQNKALEFISTTRREDFDLAEFFSIPSNIKLHPQEIEKLYVRILIKDVDIAQLEGDRQKVLEVEDTPLGKKIIMVINKTSSPYREERISEYLKADNYIQADNHKIKSIADYLSRNLTTREEKVKAILKWVYNYLEKRPTLSIPSALSALNSRQGDCNEHTFLFVALTRSIGIPTKVKNGLVYIDGKFYYHSWPAVYIDDRWVNVDPTLNQFPADVTHICLVEGELAQQMDIVRVLGKIKLEVIKYE